MFACDIAKATGGIIAGNSDIEINRIVTDSRIIAEGDPEKSAFVALGGEKFDGHVYILQVVKKGVRVVVCSRMPDDVKEFIAGENAPDVAFINVEDTLVALGRIANYHRRKYSMPICAVTGSVGKTSTKEMIAAVMSEGFNVLKTEKNFNNEIGLPMTLLKMNGEHSATVVEMGMRGLGQIDYLCNIAYPTIGVVTNIGVAHMELLGSRENIFQAKLEIAKLLPEHALLILNGDDEWLSNRDKVRDTLSQYGSNPNILYFGNGENCDYRADNVCITEDNRYSFDIVTPKESGRVTLNVMGGHNVLNALASVAVGMESGMKLCDCIKALEGYYGDGIRQNIIKSDGIIIIDDTYNAGPESMKASLNVLCNMQSIERRIAVLGDMLELGDESENAHRGVGSVCCECKVDILITVGNLMEYCADEFIKAAELKGKPIYVIKTKKSEEALDKLLSIVARGDAVLIKGSHSMQMDKVSSHWR